LENDVLGRWNYLQNHRETKSEAQGGVIYQPAVLDLGGILFAHEKETSARKDSSRRGLIHDAFAAAFHSSSHIIQKLCHMYGTQSKEMI
jgi:hypothetical protein